MKRFFIILLLLINIAYGQEDKYIDSLLQIKTKLRLKLGLLNDTLKNIDLAIYSYKAKQILKNVSDSSLVTTCRGDNAKLKANPTVVADIIATLKAGTQVIILDYVDDYFGVCVDSICGYINEMWLDKNDKIFDFMRLKEKEAVDRQRMIEERKTLENEKARQEQEQKYIKKYGQVLYNKLKVGNYWIGMNCEMAIISLGYPNDINRTVGTWGVHEQWVYSNKGIYLYFENGRITSYQD